jgi:hypothetical protein
MAGSAGQCLDLAEACNSLLKKCESLVIRKEISFSTRMFWSDMDYFFFSVECSILKPFFAVF